MYTLIVIITFLGFAAAIVAPITEMIDLSQKKAYNAAREEAQNYLAALRVRDEYTTGTQDDPMARALGMYAQAVIDNS